MLCLRYREIRDGEKIMRKIMQGETKIQRRTEIAHALNKKVSRTTNPFLSLKIDYSGLPGGRGRSFSEENDRFLVCMTDHIGYGRWEELQIQVQIQVQVQTQI